MCAGVCACACACACACGVVWCGAERSGVGWGGVERSGVCATFCVKLEMILTNKIRRYKLY